MLSLCLATLLLLQTFSDWLAGWLAGFPTFLHDAYWLMTGAAQLAFFAGLGFDRRLVTTRSLVYVFPTSAHVPDGPTTLCELMSPLSSFLRPPSCHHAVGFGFLCAFRSRASVTLCFPYAVRPVVRRLRPN